MEGLTLKHIKVLHAIAAGRTQRRLTNRNRSVRLYACGSEAGRVYAHLLRQGLVTQGFTEPALTAQGYDLLETT